MNPQEKLDRAARSLAACEHALKAARVSEGCRKELEQAAGYERAFIELNTQEESTL